MDVNAYLTIVSLLSTLLLVINIYTQTVKKPRDDHQAMTREIERSLNEFIATYSGEYAEVKVKLDTLMREVERLTQEQKVQNSALDEIARDLLMHELRTNKATDKEEK